MRKFLTFCLLLMVAISFFPVPIYAQDTATCNPSLLYEQAAGLKSSGDAKKDATDLAKFADEIRQLNITCNGFHFEGKGNKPVGTVELADGTWLITVTTKGFFMLKSKTLSGNCEFDSSMPDGFPVFSIMQGQADEGAAIVLESKGCRTLLTTENATAAWTLTFEPIS